MRRLCSWREVRERGENDTSKRQRMLCSRCQAQKNYMQTYSFHKWLLLSSYSEKNKVTTARYNLCTEELMQYSIPSDALNGVSAGLLRLPRAMNEERRRWWWRCIDCTSTTRGTTSSNSTSRSSVAVLFREASVGAGRFVVHREVHCLRTKGHGVRRAPHLMWYVSKIYNRLLRWKMDACKTRDCKWIKCRYSFSCKFSTDTCCRWCPRVHNAQAAYNLLVGAIARKHM